MTKKEAKSCIGTIEMLQRLAYNIHGVMDVIDADNCKKIIKALEQEPILDKIRAEIEQDMEQERFARSVFRGEEKDAVKAEQCTGSIYAFHSVIGLIDKYKTESENP